MCEICDQLKEMGRIEGLEEGELIGISKGEIIGMEKGYVNGKLDILMSQLRKKLGYLSENIIKIINSLDEKAINTIALNIFDIDNEEDILKYILG